MTYALVVLVVSCLGRGEGWTEKLYGSFASLEDCIAAKATWTTGSADLAIGCAVRQPQPVLTADLNGDGAFGAADVALWTQLVNAAKGAQ